MPHKVTRYKLRTCIRKDTYCYRLSEASFSGVKKKIAQKYGELKAWGNFNILQVETRTFILRVFEDNYTLTLIQKNDFTKNDEDEIFNIIGYTDE